MNSSLYNCRVLHKRYLPREYGFSANLFMWHLDLDELGTLSSRLTFFSHNRANIYSFRDDDHLQLGFDSLKENVAAYLRQNGEQEIPTKITILTNLRTFGYVFNPVSFIFCYDANQDPLAVIVEVHNTFGELKPFFLGKEDLQRNCFSAVHPKLFYISPFSHLNHSLQIKVTLPGKRLGIVVNDIENGEKNPFFKASLTGRNTRLSNNALIRFSLRFPFITLRIISSIHFHAMRLWFKKVPYHKKSDQPEFQQGIYPGKS